MSGLNALDGATIRTGHPDCPDCHRLLLTALEDCLTQQGPTSVAMSCRRGDGHEAIFGMPGGRDV